MASYNVKEAKAQVSKLLGRVVEGDNVLITRDGVPVAELVPVRGRAFPLGAGRDDPNVNFAALNQDDWWRPMADEDVDNFLDGRD